MNSKAEDTIKIVLWSKVGIYTLKQMQIMLVSDFILFCFGNDDEGQVGGRVEAERVGARDKGKYYNIRTKNGGRWSCSEVDVQKKSTDLHDDQE